MLCLGTILEKGKFLDKRSLAANLTNASTIQNQKSKEAILSPDFSKGQQQFVKAPRTL